MLALVAKVVRLCGSCSEAFRGIKMKKSGIQYVSWRNRSHPARVTLLVILVKPVHPPVRMDGGWAACRALLRKAAA